MLDEIEPITAKGIKLKMTRISVSLVLIFIILVRIRCCRCSQLLFLALFFPVGVRHPLIDRDGFDAKHVFPDFGYHWNIGGNDIVGNLLAAQDF